jgi:hypothetical protein
MTTEQNGDEWTFSFEIPNTLPPLPRLGIVIELPREYELLTWHGRGPWDNYPDRKASCPIGWWQSTISQQYVHYPRPQDSGNHEDCTLVELKTKDDTATPRSGQESGKCLRIEASVIKGTNQMADKIQEIYIIPAGSGSIVARACYAIEGAEGFGRRFAYMVRTLNALERDVEAAPVEDELALSIIRNYCLSENPDLQQIVDAGEYPVSWEIASSDEQQVVILFRSYTGALVRYYIDRATGDTYVTEFVPGITAEEQRTEESFNLWDQVG